MFYRDALGTYRTGALDGFVWLVYGFGTRASPSPPRIATLHQVHSDVVVPAAGGHGCLGEGDALISNTPGALVGVKTADCLPILLVDDRNRAVAAVHAGWRGTVSEITRKAVASMGREFDTRASDLHAAIGPSIGGCCFEVGPEVASRFGRSGRVKIDLPDLNRQQLIYAGVAPDRIYLCNLCTVCGGQEFCSYRREKEGAGRMISFVGVR